jgi:hypothetical protein
MEWIAEAETFYAWTPARTAGDILIASIKPWLPAVMSYLMLLEVVGIQIVAVAFR